MKKIRQHNDIDISLLLKNSQGEILNPEQCNKMSVRLRCGGFIVYKTPTVSAGLINIRFNAYEQHRTGEYDITLSAETKDGRTFTTDICKAFCIVPCSCETGGKTDEITIDTIDVCATFDITAWGMTDIEDIDQIREGATKGMTALQEYYDDGSGEVVPVKHPDLSTQPSILSYKFGGNYVYEQMFYVESGVNDGMTAWDKTICELPNDFLLLEMFGQIERADGSVMVIAEPFPGTPDIYFTVSLDGNKLRAHGAGNDFKSAWFRVVWTTKPKAGGYYYASEPQSALIFKNIDAVKDYLPAFRFNAENNYSDVHVGESFIVDGENLITFRRNDSYATGFWMGFDSSFVLEYNGYYKRATSGLWLYKNPLQDDCTTLSIELPTAYEDLENNKKVVVNMYKPWSIKLKIGVGFGVQPTVSVVRKSTEYVYCELTQTGQECELPIEFLNNSYEIRFDGKGTYAGISYNNGEERHSYGQGSIIDIESIKKEMPNAYAAMIGRNDVVLNIEST